LSIKYWQHLSIIGVLIVISHHAFGQESLDQRDHSFALAAGVAIENNLANKTSSSGSTLSAEFTPIEDVLEIEVGTTLLNSSGEQELAEEVLFKSPYRLSSTSELDIGIGTQFSRKLQGADSASSFGMAFALEFMFWPSKEIGWSFNPEYGYGLGNSKGEQTIGASIEILFGW